MSDVGFGKGAKRCRSTPNYDPAMLSSKFLLAAFVLMALVLPAMGQTPAAAEPTPEPVPSFADRARAVTVSIQKECERYKFTHLLVEADLELWRATGDAAIMARARRNGEAARERWKRSPPKELIEQAGIARMLWLLADQETEVGREYWKKTDGVGEAGR